MGSKFYLRLAMVFIAISMFSFIAVAQTTINLIVSDKDDDVEEYREVYSTSPAGFMDLGSSDLELCTQNANNRQYVGIIWRNVAIPKGSSITSAFLQLTADDISSNGTAPTLGIDIYGIKEANTSAPFTDVLFNLSSRPVTTAKVTWDALPWEVIDERGPKQKSPDLKTIIQEIVNQAGWASGNNLGIRLQNEVLEKIHREAEAADESTNGDPELIVTFTAGTGINSIDAPSSGLIYPNPTKGKLYINNPSTDEFSYLIYNICGKLVSSRLNITGPTTEVDLTGFNRGIYIVDVRNAEKAIAHKLILQ